MSLVHVALPRAPSHRSIVFTADEAERRLSHLRALGFSREDADKVFEAIDLPTPEKIDARISDLRAAGFTDPVKMITSSPAILGYAIDNIRGKISDLRAAGFTDPVKMITSSPAILGLSIDNIRGKISDLRAAGFTDPVKMITSLPAILGYAIDNIRGKISDLRAAGFTDPVKMITSSPVILGYSRERLALCCRIVAGLEDRSDAQLARLTGLPRSLLEALAAQSPCCWRDVLALRKNLRTAQRIGL
ncbi:mTERF protein [Methylovirgula ligni]|uniref:mTERF protein n=1 Tax=Methylovirgula ligni TaxID=569860 RepID=A0A3D9YP55_9HYPH|nr:hypothetical protein [Methylovirgula ligni]REF83273.1 mTERF protein [Methylovirgula ligni]